MMVPSISSSTQRIVMSAVPSLDAGLGIVGNPACLIGEDPNGTDTRLWTEIEPVFRLGRYGQQIARLAMDGEHFFIGCFLVKPEKALSFDEETDFIFTMGMFAEKFIPDCGQIWSLGRHPYDVRGSIAVLLHKGLEPMVVNLQDLGL